MAKCGDRVCLMHPVLRVAQFYRIGFDRDPMTLINKFLFVTPTAVLMKQVDIKSEMQRLESPFWFVGMTGVAPGMPGVTHGIRLRMPAWRGLPMYVGSRAARTYYFRQVSTSEVMVYVRPSGPAHGLNELLVHLRA